MKKDSIHIIFLLLAVLMACNAGAQATIGANKAPDKDAVLELVSGTKGLLLPRVAEADRPAKPTAGLLIFNTTTRMVEYYNSSKWVPVQAAPAVAEISTVPIRREQLTAPLQLELTDAVIICTNNQTGELVLPAASDMKGKIYHLKIAGTGNVVVRSKGNGLIDEVAQYEIPGGARLSLQFVSDGQQWNVLN